MPASFSTIRRWILVVVGAAVVLPLLVTLVRADPPPVKSVAQGLQEVSVTVKAGTSRGSGVLRVSKDGRVWVLTAGHVIDGLRKTRETLNPSGSRKTVVEFEDPQILKFVKEDGRKVGEYAWDTEVVRYSPADHGEDLALLRVRSTSFRPSASVQFYLDKSLPALGVDLFHCGSPMGEMGSDTLTSGILAQHGRLFDGRVYDQTTCSSLPGSSGGMVALKNDGRYVGMVVLGIRGSDTFNYIVPVRRIQTWAKRTGVDFVMDDKLPVPSEEVLWKVGIEESR